MGNKEIVINFVPHWINGRLFVYSWFENGVVEVWRYEGDFNELVYSLYCEVIEGYYSLGLSAG